MLTRRQRVEAYGTAIIAPLSQFSVAEEQRVISHHRLLLIRHNPSPKSFSISIAHLACLSGISHITCPLAIPDRRQVQDGTDVSPSVSGPAERDSGGQSNQVLRAVLAQLSHLPLQTLKPSHPGAEKPCSVLHGIELHGPNSGTPLSEWPLLSLAADKDPARGGHISTAIRADCCQH